MKTKELYAILEEVGVDVPHGTLLRWRHEGLIPQPTWVGRGKDQGSGRLADWPDNTVELVAAIYALRQPVSKKKKPTVSVLKQIRDCADMYLATLDRYKQNTYDPRLVRFYNTVFASFDIPTITDAPDQGGWQLGFVSYELSPLVVKWIVTVEKVRKRIPVTTPARVCHFLCRTVPDQDPVSAANAPFVFKGRVICTLSEDSVDELQLITRLSCDAVSRILEATGDMTPRCEQVQLAKWRS